MTKQEWIEKLKRELKLRNYADSTISTYAGSLSVILNDYHKYNGYKDVEDIKSFLLTITNQNYTFSFCFFAASFISTSIMLAWLRSFFSASNFKSCKLSSDNVNEVFCLGIKCYYNAV